MLRNIPLNLLCNIFVVVIWLVNTMKWNTHFLQKFEKKQLADSTQFSIDTAKKVSGAKIAFLDFSLMKAKMNLGVLV